VEDLATGGIGVQTERARHLVRERGIKRSEARQMSNSRPTVSIVIKALNEERHVAAAIESALAALDGIDGEVILADSCSTDRTVAIAARYPIKIVTLSRIGDRSCGAGVQLGYQYSTGRYVYLMDGDMRLRKSFLPAAVRFLESNARFGGVGGLIVERETRNFEYVKRATADDVDRRPGEVTRLDCGGLYRRAAIAATGYFGDRNLHSIEELELGVRLVAAGWKLARIDIPAIDHYGHSGNAYSMLLRRWKTGFAFGPGEILRSALGRDRFWLTLTRLRREVALLAAVHLWWLCLIVASLVLESPIAAALTAAMLALVPFAVMSARCRSVSLGVYSVAAWNVYAAGLWPGLLHARIDPSAWIDSVVIRDAAAGKAATTAPLQPSVHASSRVLNPVVRQSGANTADGDAVSREQERP
jgi:glycosyltransferase involved in cell wall biosynthesis